MDVSQLDVSQVPLATRLLLPGVIAVLGFAQLLLWSLDRRRSYVLLLVPGCLLTALGLVVQETQVPDGTTVNALTAGVLQTVGVLSLAEGIMRRSGQGLGLRRHAAILVAVMTGLWLFSVPLPALVVRIYVQNLGYGAVFAVTALRLGRHGSMRPVDRLLRWSVWAFAAQFAIRTALTVDVNGMTLESLTAFWRLLTLSIAVMGVAMLLVLMAAVVADVTGDLRRERDTDHLTGLLNRRAFEAAARAVLDRDGPAVVVLADLDHFKQVNDRFGHRAGDVVLQAVGGLLAELVGPGGVVGRLGGEEFALLLRTSSVEDGHRTALGVRDRLRGLDLDAIPGGPTVTASFGVAQVQGAADLAAAIARADDLLYAAKAAGRDRVRFTPEASVAAPRRRRPRPAGGAG